jgi:hypothetical protein
MRFIRRVLFMIIATVLTGSLMFSQNPTGSKPVFEVASVKPHAGGDNRVMIMNPPGGRFVATNVILKQMITFAYGVRDMDMFGGPAWLTSDRWDFAAKAEEGSRSRPRPAASSATRGARRRASRELYASTGCGDRGSDRHSRFGYQHESTSELSFRQVGPARHR